MPLSKEKMREYARQYRLKNKEKTNEYRKQYCLNNKEKLKQKRIENKEYKKEYNKRQHKTPTGIKSKLITSWKIKGIISDDYNLLYANYLAETHCDFCRVKFGKKGDGSGTFKCCDHDHETGLFRNFLCCACNRKRG